MQFYKYSILILMLLGLAALPLSAQVGINENGTAPDSSAMLDIESTDKGLLIPRMTTAQRDAIANPATGLMVYVTDGDRFYSFNGTEWSPIGESLETIQQTDSLDVYSPCEQAINLDGSSGIINTMNKGWQSFIPTEAGFVCEFRASIVSSLPLDSGFIRIYQGEGVSGLLLYEGHIQNISGINSIITFPEYTVFLEKDSLYTVQLEDTVDKFRWRNSADLYAGGRSSVSATRDFLLKVSLAKSLGTYSWGNFVTSALTNSDNLGNHTADTTLNLNGHYLSGDGDKEGVYVAANGQVGIGTDAPAAPLQVSRTGNRAFIAVERTDGAFMVPLATTIYSGIGFDHTAPFRLGPVASIGANPDESNSIHVTPAGRMGQGTESPESRFHLVSANEGDTSGIKLSVGNANSLFYHENGDLIIRKGNQANQLVLDETGNVGIGTDSAITPLHISRTGMRSSLSIDRTDGTFVVPFAGSGYSGIGFDHATPFRIGPVSSIGANPTANTSMTFTPTGRVGIGTDTPDALLQVSSTGANSSFAVDRTDGKFMSASALPNYSIIGFDTTGRFRIGPISSVGNIPQAGTSMTFTSSGRVGLGTASPATKLEVDGTVTANSIAFPNGTIQSTAAPSTGIYTVGTGDFVGLAGTAARTSLSGGLGGSYMTGPSSVHMLAPVHLPHGATVTTVRFYGYDLHNTNIQIELVRKAFASSTEGILANHTSSTSSGAYSGTDNTVLGATIDNSAYTYFIFVEVVGGSWHSQGELAVNGVVIEYDMP